MQTLYGNFEKKIDSHGAEKTFLLGVDADGVKYWLEAPSWNCGWYWGFGYIKTYVRNFAPSKARDIDSHQHADNFYPEWTLGKESRLTATTFTEAEAWKLAKLFKQFYTLKASAEMFGRGGCHITTTTDGVAEDKALAKRINEIEIPKVTAAILAILTP